MIALFLLAAASAAGAAPASSPPPRNFLKGAESRACADGAKAGEVVVCGRRDGEQAHRLRPIDDARFAERPAEAAVRLGNARIKAHGGQAEVGGFTSPRAMVTLSLPF